MKLQIKEIKIYSRLLKVSEDIGCMIWVKKGLAKRFAIKYREKFGLNKEPA